MNTVKNIMEITTKLTECEYDRLHLQELLLRMVVKNTKMRNSDKSVAFQLLRKINSRQLEILKVS